MRVEHIAAVCHDANRALARGHDDFTLLDWSFADDQQKASMIRGVRFALANPDAPASAQHEAWARNKVVNGWTLGAIKDAEAKTHPNLVPFDQLPPIQRAKDHLFKSIVNALAPFVTADDGAEASTSQTS